MKWEAAILLSIGTFGGCAAPEPAVAVVFHDDIPIHSVANRPANLILGPTREHARLGEWFAVRSDWPATDYGLRLEDVSTYSDVTFDDQAYYDRYGGAFFKVQSSARAGIVVR